MLDFAPPGIPRDGIHVLGSSVSFRHTPLYSHFSQIIYTPLNHQIIPLYQHPIRRPPFNLQRGGGAGVFVANKIFISTRPGGALKILNFIACLYSTVLEVNYFFSGRVCTKLFISQILQPSPWRLNGDPLIIT